MRFKKYVLFALALPTCVTTGFAADGTINFIGNITDTACTVVTSSANQTINLGSVSSKAFSAVGATASPTRFTISLSACPAAVTSANVRFDGLTSSANTSILALNANQDAKNVGVAIYEENSTTLIPVGTPSANKTLTSTGTNNLNYIAKYISTAMPVAAGSANATVSFTIAYN